MTVDLQGYTIRAMDAYLIDVYFDYSKNTANLGFTSSIHFKNGGIRNGREGTRIKSDGSVASNEQPMVGLGHTNALGSGYTRKELNFIFENVTFSTVLKPIIQDWGHSQDNGGLIVNVTANDCTFDYTGAPSGVSFFKMDTTKTNVTSTVKINGAKVIADDFSKYSLYTLGTADTAGTGFDADTALVGAGKGGTILTLTQASTAAAPSATFPAASGKTLTWGIDGTVGDNTVYLLGEPIATSYGEIPFTYQSVTLYPFVAFTEKGEFLAAHALFLDRTDSYDNDGIINIAKGYMTANVWDGTSYGTSARAVTVLMRRDYTMADVERYNNFSQVQGTLTIDLGGFTLTSPTDKATFVTTVKPWSGSGDANIFPTTVEVENGSIVTKNKALVQFDAWTGAADNDYDYLKDKIFSFVFTGVDVKLSGTAGALVDYVNSATPNAIANTNVTFEDCKFDLTAAPSGFTVFSTGNNKIYTNVTVNGGEIIAHNMTGITLASTSANTVAELIFGKGEDGKLLEITLDLSADAPLGEYASVLGTAVFAKLSEGRSSATYRLTAKALVDFSIKSSVTLYSNLGYNIYISAVSELSSFTVGEDEYLKADFEGLTKKELDGAEYYVVTVMLDAFDALDDIPLTVVIELGDGEVLSGKYTFGVVSYVRRVLETSGSETERTVACDMLSYIRAAYAYKNKTHANLSAIDEILGEGYDESNAPAFDGEAVKPEAGQGTTGATLVLTSAPAYRFYLADGVTSDTIVFTHRGKAVKHTSGSDGKGSYVEVSPYAFGMSDEISYTALSGELSGSYNVKAYYEWAITDSTTKDNAALIALVERFMRYAESAEAYRAYVAGN